MLIPSLENSISSPWSNYSNGMLYHNILGKARLITQDLIKQVFFILLVVPSGVDALFLGNGRSFKSSNNIGRSKSFG